MTVKTKNGNFIKNVRTVAFDEEHLVGSGKVVIYQGDDKKTIIKASDIDTITQI